LAGGGRGLDDVPQLDSAMAQIYHAQMYGGEAAWQRAIDYPDAGDFETQLAKRGLVRYRLLIEQNWRAALNELRPMEQGSRGDENLRLLHAFSLAGLCIAYEKLGDKTAALAVQERLDATMRQQLREEEPQMHELLRESLRRLGVT